MIIVATLLIISAVVYIIARALTKYYTENYTDNYPELYVSKGSDECQFEPTSNTSSATICANCGREKFLHTT